MWSTQNMNIIHSSYSWKASLTKAQGEIKTARACLRGCILAAVIFSFLSCMFIWSIYLMCFILWIKWMNWLIELFFLRRLHREGYSLMTVQFTCTRSTKRINTIEKLIGLFQLGSFKEMKRYIFLATHPLALHDWMTTINWEQKGACLMY